PVHTGGADAPWGMVTATSHENGHGFGLSHQADLNDGSVIKNGDYSSNNNSPRVAPIMGVGYYTKRGTWRIGHTSSGSLQNDAKVIANNPGMGGFVEDGIGHFLNTATPLHVFTNSASGKVDYNITKGLIVPLRASYSKSIGSNKYSHDVLTFHTVCEEISLTVYAGGELRDPCQTDPYTLLNPERKFLNMADQIGVTASTPDLTKT